MGNLKAGRIPASPSTAVRKLDARRVEARHGGHDGWAGGEGRAPPSVALAGRRVNAVERDGQLAPRGFRGHLRSDPAGLGGPDGAEEDPPEGQAVFPPHQAVDDGVEAAAGEGQAVGHGEEVRLSPDEGLGQLQQVQLDERAPEREHVVREPAGAEGQHHHRHRLGDVGLPPGSAAPQVVAAQEAQEEQVGEGDDGVREQEAQHHPQELVDPQPGRAVGEAQDARRVVAPARVHQLGEEGAGERRRQRRRPDDGRGHLGGARPGAEGSPGFERRRHVAVAGQAHGGEEEAAGVDVEGREEARRLAHGGAERPAVVQRHVHGPEDQHGGEEQVGQGQVEHEEVDGPRGDGVGGVEQEHHQHVHQDPRRRHDGVDRRHDHPHPQQAVVRELQLAVHAGEGPVEAAEDQVGGVAGEARVANAPEALEAERAVGVGHGKGEKGGPISTSYHL